MNDVMLFLKYFLNIINDIYSNYCKRPVKGQAEFQKWADYAIVLRKELSKNGK